MSTAAEIEEAVRHLPEAEKKAFAKWFQEYLLQQTAQGVVPDKRAFAKWRGRGKLPVGRTADEYLQLIRDGNGS